MIGANIIPGDSIDNIPIGLKASFSKTVAESDIYLFAGITGDVDRNHIDEQYCKTTSFGHRIAHGALIIGLMSTTSSLIIQGLNRPLVSLGYDRIRFLKPVFIGDTVTVVYEIVEIDQAKERTVAKVEAYNQDHELVAVATHIQKLVS